MRAFPAPIHAAAAAIGKLPAVGPKTALRYVFALLRMTAEERDGVARSIAGLRQVTLCASCFTYAEQSPCEICTDPERSATELCVVAEARDISTIEATHAYRGRYFVLGGVLNPVEGMTPDRLRADTLVAHLQSHEAVREIILAFSPDIHGETTMLYLARLLKPFNKTVTRLARGLPMGADIEYADEVTLAQALQGRNAV